MPWLPRSTRASLAGEPRADRAGRSRTMLRSGSAAEWAARVTIAMALLTGCEAEPPDGDAARAFYAAHTDAVDAFDAATRAAVADIPWLESAEPGCEPSDEDAPATEGADEDGALSRRMRGMQCTQRRLARLEARDRAISRFSREGLPRLVRAAGALSARLSYARGGDAVFHLGGVEPAPPTAREGAVRAARGVSVGDRRLGWGLYATRWTDAEGVPHGTEAFTPGFEIAWAFQVGDAEINVSLFYLSAPR